MEELKKIWLNEKFVGWQEAKVHVLSHALHYGSGVFEGIRVYQTKMEQQFSDCQNILKDFSTLLFV